MREKLMALDETGKPIRVSIIGCGRFGSMMVAQIRRAPGMTISVVCDADGQRALEALQLAGYDPEDPASVRAERVDYTEGLDGGVRGMRIGVPKEYVWEVMDAEVEASFRKAMSVFEELGASIEEISIPELAWVPPIAIAITTSEAAALYGDLVREQGDRFDQSIRRRIESGLFIPAERYLQALRARVLFTRRLSAVFQRVDLLATPTVAIPAPLQGVETMPVPKSQCQVRLT